MPRLALGAMARCALAMAPIKEGVLVRAAGFPVFPVQPVAPCRENTDAPVGMALRAAAPGTFFLMQSAGTVPLMAAQRRPMTDAEGAEALRAAWLASRRNSGGP